MILWILLLILIVIIFGIGFFVRILLWFAIALLLIWLIVVLLRAIRR
jgi:hypothetical protein